MAEWEVCELFLLRNLPLSLPVRGYLVTPTDVTGIQGLQGWPKEAHSDKLAEYRILLQEDPLHISVLLNKLKSCL